MTEEIIQYRMQKALKAWQEAEFNLQNHYYDTALNRLYYAAFYAVSALLVKHEMDTYTHKGVRTLLAQHFVKTGQVSLEMNDLFNELFDKRQKGDYADFVNYIQTDIEPLLQPTKDFIQHIQQLLEHGK